MRARRTVSILATLAMFASAAAFISAPSARAGTGSSDWKQVSAGARHTCAVTTAGRLFCWGEDAYGQLGNGDPTDFRLEPDEVAGGGTKWAAVAAGGYFTCGRKQNGKLFCWGDDQNGQLGDNGTTGDQASPVEVLGHP